MFKAGETTPVVNSQIVGIYDFTPLNSVDSLIGTSVFVDPQGAGIVRLDCNVHPSAFKSIRSDKGTERVNVVMPIKSCLEYLVFKITEEMNGSLKMRDHDAQTAKAQPFAVSALKQRE